MAFYGVTVSYTGDPIQGRPIFTTSANNDDTVTITGCTANCSGDLVIPDAIAGKAVTSISDLALRDKGLTSVSIPSSVTSIGQAAFATNQLTSATIPSSVTSIGNNAFGNNLLTSVTFLGDGPADGGQVFDSNSALSSVVVPSNAIGFGEAFSGVTVSYTGDPIESRPVFTTSDNSDGTVTITDCIANCSSDLVIQGTVAGKTVTSIGPSALSRKGLTSVSIPNSVTSIGRRAFMFNSLKSVTLSSSVTNIYDSAFYNNQLTSVTIPSSVTSIGSYAFYNNPLKSVTFLGDGPPDDGTIFNYYPDESSLVVPIDAIGFGASFSTIPVSRSGAEFHHTVTYIVAGGSAVDQGSFTTGGSIQTAPVSTLAGYTLSGWSATEAGPVVKFPYSPTATTNITLYAIWVLNPVKATYVTGAKVNGTSKVGKSVSAVTGSWNGTKPITFTYQWYSCKTAGKKVLTTGKAAAKCTVIKQATKSTFKVTAKVKGTFLAVLITGTNRAGKTTVFTNTTAKVS